jgi:hypothetical protein
MLSYLHLGRASGYFLLAFPPKSYVQHISKLFLCSAAYVVCWPVVAEICQGNRLCYIKFESLDGPY